MSDYILREVGKALDRPTRQEVLERLRARPVRHLRRSAAEVYPGQRDCYCGARCVGSGRAPARYTDRTCNRDTHRRPSSRPACSNTQPNQEPQRARRFVFRHGPYAQPATSSADCASWRRSPLQITRSGGGAPGCAGRRRRTVAEAENRPRLARLVARQGSNRPCGQPSRIAEPGPDWVLGFPDPELQVEFVLSDGRRAFTDFFWPDRRHVGEFDGASKYRDPALLDGRSPEQVLVDEKDREDELRRQVRAFSRWRVPALRRPADALPTSSWALGCRPHARADPVVELASSRRPLPRSNPRARLGSCERATIRQSARRKLQRVCGTEHAIARRSRPRRHTAPRAGQPRPARPSASGLISPSTGLADNPTAPVPADFDRAAPTAMDSRRRGSSRGAARWSASSRRAWPCATRR